MIIEQEVSQKNYEAFIPLVDVKDQLRIVNDIYDKTLRRIRKQVIDLAESCLSIDICPQIRVYPAEKIKCGVSVYVAIPENHNIKTAYFSDEHHKAVQDDSNLSCVIDCKHDRRILLGIDNEIKLDSTQEISELKYIVCETELKSSDFKFLSLKSTILEHIECIYEKRQIDSITQFYMRFYKSHKEFNI